MSLLTDSRASLEIPVRLVIYVILMAAIAAVTSIGLSQISPLIEGDIMEKQIGEIKASLSILQKGGTRNLIDPESESGNIRIQKISISEDEDFIAFGVDPDPDNDYNLTNTPLNLTTERGNVIFYRSGPGKIRVPLDESIELREGRLENGKWVVNNIGGMQHGAVISGKGIYEIIFELVYDPVSKERFTLVRFTDNLNAYINPYEPAALPNSLWVSLSPDSVPADGITQAEIFIKLKDNKGRDAPADDIYINLSASIGNLSMSNLITANGKAEAEITSDTVGTSVITATSPGLNPATTHLTVTQEPIIMEFNQWIYNEDEKINLEFITDEALKFNILLTGYGTDLVVPFAGVFWPNACIEIDGVQIGEQKIDSEYEITRLINTTMLPAGNHSLNISLENDKYMPLIGDTNLFVKNVMLSE